MLLILPDYPFYPYLVILLILSKIRFKLFALRTVHGTVHVYLHKHFPQNVTMVMNYSFILLVYLEMVLIKLRTPRKHLRWRFLRIYFISIYLSLANFISIYN